MLGVRCDQGIVPTTGGGGCTRAQRHPSYRLRKFVLCVVHEVCVIDTRELVGCVGRAGRGGWILTVHRKQWIRYAHSNQ